MDKSELDFFEKLASRYGTGPERWHDTIVSTPHGHLSKQSMFNYYSMPVIREAIMAQIKNNPSIIYQHFSPTEPVLKRWEKGQPIVVRTDAGNVEDPSDYQYWIERRAVEFHPALGDKTKTVWVDIDPGDQFDWKKTKETVQKVKDLVDRHKDVHDASIRFSGGNGFYVIGELKDEIPTDQAKPLVQGLLKPLMEDKSLTMGFARPDQLRLDTSTLKNTGSIRGIYSLNKNTGLVSIPVEEEHLEEFEPEHASIFHVVGRIPPRAKAIRQ